MSYQGISIKEAISKINSDNAGWFLPAIQRPYVWGNRYESEQYICKLFDSIIRGYPIGGLILWNTDEKIAYREFTSNYEDGLIPRIVEKGHYGRADKWLVYDGQQRMQTLYSCLKYSFNDKILIVDLLFNHESKDDPKATAFSFVKKNSSLDSRYIKMPELFWRKPTDNKTAYRREIMKQMELTQEEEELVENNIDNLWDIFVKTETHSLAYFSIQSSDEYEVNEIFERLNSGGMALSLSDLLFTKIKSEKTENNDNYDFEENLQLASKHIYSDTGNGFSFGAYSILQLINLIVKGAVRVDPKKVKPEELPKYSLVWEKLRIPLNTFFTSYLYGQFKINKASIIPRQLALLPMIVYFYELYNKGIKFKHIEDGNLQKLNQYFIKSQINDWNMQSYIDNFTKIIIELSEKSGNKLFDFPISQIEEYIEQKQTRSIEINTTRFVSYLWFSLKILIPDREYLFKPDQQERLNPEIDHIFPRKLIGMNDEYKKDVDILWNMQPVMGKINEYKLNYHPKEFFTNSLTNSSDQVIAGSKYLSDYDFLPDLNSQEWNDYKQFIQIRKDKMISYMKNHYDISIES